MRCAITPYALRDLSRKNSMIRARRCAERLVHRQDRGLDSERARDLKALAHAAG
jgi:hypothetical protein